MLVVTRPSEMMEAPLATQLLDSDLALQGRDAVHSDPVMFSRYKSMNGVSTLLNTPMHHPNSACCRPGERTPRIVAPATSGETQVLAPKMTCSLLRPAW
jgi:hypothetical protein